MYGIKNCDTVKKAQKWLAGHEIKFEFHDFKTQGLTADLLTAFQAKADFSLLLNKRSTTFRNLPDDIKNNLTDEVIFQAIIAQPTLLKRPIVLHNEQLHLGFKADQYQLAFT
jgi:arsenate reductase